MRIMPVSFIAGNSQNCAEVKPNYSRSLFNQGFDKVDFQGLMPNKTKEALKMCVFDLDETLLEGTQEFRNKVFDFAKGNNKILIYSSARPIGKVQPLIEKGTLIMPDWCVCNNGINIYKNNNGTLEEIKPWYDSLIKSFDKEKIREVMLGIAKKNMFSPEEWAKIPQEKLPESYKEFRGSKITEYDGFVENSNARFMMVPGTYAKIKDEFESKLAELGLKTNVTLQIYDKNELVPGFLEKYFSPEISEGIRGHHFPRMDKDGNVEVAFVSVKTDKGKATEYIRKVLGIKPKEILASGDAENDFTHANKGYFFAFIANSTKELKHLIETDTKVKQTRIFKTSKPGVEGIYEVIEA